MVQENTASPVLGVVRRGLESAEAPYERTYLRINGGITFVWASVARNALGRGEGGGEKEKMDGGINGRGKLPLNGSG